MHGRRDAAVPALFRSQRACRKECRIWYVVILSHAELLFIAVWQIYMFSISKLLLYIPPYRGTLLPSRPFDIPLDFCFCLLWIAALITSAVYLVVYFYRPRLRLVTDVTSLSRLGRYARTWSDVVSACVMCWGMFQCTRVWKLAP